MINECFKTIDFCMVTDLRSLFEMKKENNHVLIGNKVNLEVSLYSVLFQYHFLNKI